MAISRGLDAMYRKGLSQEVGPGREIHQRPRVRTASPGALRPCPCQPEIYGGEKGTSDQVQFFAYHFENVKDLP